MSVFPLSLRGEGLCDIAKAVEHVELFVSTLQKLEVCGGDNLRNAGFLQVRDVARGLSNIEVQKLVEQLLAIVAIEDKVLGDSLDVGVGGSSCANHGRDHQNSLVGDHTRDIFYVIQTKASLFGIASTSLQCVYAATKVTITQVNELINDALRLQIDLFYLTYAE